LPFPVSGKVDRGDLVSRSTTEPVSRGDGPRSALETVVTGIWAEVLDVREVSLDHDFFSLGGDSVHAGRIAARLRHALDLTDLSLRAVFSTLTAGAMSDWLRAHDPTGHIDTVAEVYLDVESMSEDEIDAELPR
jgi:mycobactin phenyloxazoline synthetase